ncbi:hypothetical protein Tco_0611302 [Tanacetum coccineum]
MEGYKLNDLKLKDFDSIQVMFDRAFKRVNTFEDFRTELVKGKEKRAGTELAQEITKNQKVEDDKETAEIKKLMEIILDEEEVTINAIPLAVKSPNIKSVLTQKGLDIFCHKFHIPDDVHPHYRINMSQLSVIAATKVSHFKILCRIHDIEPTVGLFHYFYINSKYKGWMSFSKRSDMDVASFPWHTCKNVSRDPFPKSTKFNADDYVVLIAHPAPFWKFPEPFLCLVRMSCYYTLDEDTYPIFLHDDRTEMGLYAFIYVVDPTKVKVFERERAEGKARLLDSTIGRVVPLLPVALACAKSELEASVDKLFDEGGSADQGDSAADGGHDAEIELVTGVENIAAENHKSGAPTDSITGLNLHTIGASERFIISSDSSHHSNTNASGAEGDSIIRSAVIPPVMTKAVVTSHAVNAPSVSVLETGTKVTSPVHASMFHDFDFTETVKADVAVFVPQWNVLNDSLLDDSGVSREFVDHLAPPALFSQICEMDYHHLFTEFNVGTARQACLNAEVRMQTGYYLSERKRLESDCESQADLLKAKDVEIENLKAQLLLKEAEAAKAVHLRLQSLISTKDLELKDVNVVASSLKSHNDGLVDQVHMLETTCSSLRDQVSGYERLKEQIKEFQDAQINIVNDKVAKLDADLLEMALHLEDNFYHHLLATISSQRWLLTNGLKLVVLKCLNLPEYLTALGSAISHAIEKGINYDFALRRFREVDLPLLAELSSHKDASVGDIISLLRLESPLADAPRMSDLPPNIEQLTLPIHHSKDQVVLGETSLSFSLSVANSRVERIKENVLAQRLALVDVWVSLVDPLSAKNLMGTDGQKDAQGNVQGNVASVPIVEFEKEELDTTP